MLRASLRWLLLLLFATFVCCWFSTRPVTSLDEMNDDASFLFSVMLSRLSTVHWICFRYNFDYYAWVSVCVSVRSVGGGWMRKIFIYKIAWKSSSLNISIFTSLCWDCWAFLPPPRLPFLPPPDDAWTEPSAFFFLTFFVFGNLLSFFPVERLECWKLIL